MTAFSEAEQRLVEAMAEIMVRHRGVGLAAPQAGVPARIILIHPSLLPAGCENIFINPEVVAVSREEEKEEEGCLSLLSIAAELKRPAKVAVRFTTAGGQQREVEAEGFGARALLHEIDHLNGVLFIDHLSRLKRREVTAAFMKLYRELGLDTATPAANEKGAGFRG